MNGIQRADFLENKKSYESKAGYVFFEGDVSWKLDKNTTVPIRAVKTLLQENVGKGFEKTLAYFASNLSASHTDNLCRTFKKLITVTGSSEVNESMLINFKSTLTSDVQWYMGVIRVLLKKWYELGHYGVSGEIIDLLDGWRIKGNVKGDVVKRLDPLEGPFSDIELLGFNEGLVAAFEKGLIEITGLAIGMVLSNTGRRPVQISHLKIKDILQGKNHKDEPIYLLNVPRAKQRNARFREIFKQFAITYELSVILNAQSTFVLENAKNQLPFQISEYDLVEMPLFPDWMAISKLESVQAFREVIESDRLHITSANITLEIQKIAHISRVYSERTGNPLHVTSKRFRYTTGTRAAREGLGSMVIAELLDHSDNQNSHVYIQNIPEHAAQIDQALGHQLAPYAQAFAGVLVDAEKDAQRGNDINSRVKCQGEGVGTCGSHGFCGANVPIPCYTCMNFQPWLDGPHQRVYEELISDRERILKLIGDIEIASINDRSILAVANVIQLCKKRSEELGNG